MHPAVLSHGMLHLCMGVVAGLCVMVIVLPMVLSALVLCSDWGCECRRLLVVIQVVVGGGSGGGAAAAAGVVVAAVAAEVCVAACATCFLDLTLLLRLWLS